MESEEFMKISIVIYKSGLFTVMCEGGEVDCKIVSYAIKMILDVVGYTARTLVKTLIEEVSREMEGGNKPNNGTM
jgi:hypothetical protein